MCRKRSSGLSSLKPQLDVCGVPLYAVVKEHVGAEIDSFRPFFCGEIFLDETRCFYGNKPRKMMGLAFVRVGVWLNVLRAWRRGYVGNNIGEGFILGGLYVIGPGDQGILMEHQEKEFGHTADLRSVLEAH
uniref:Peroxiredoxin-like 2A n=1 Tax=Electrophorus electricus TaxID=8005 RepID=A0A4W4EUV5_ELEEL